MDFSNFRNFVSKIFRTHTKHVSFRQKFSNRFRTNFSDSLSRRIFELSAPALHRKINESYFLIIEWLQLSNKSFSSTNWIHCESVKLPFTTSSLSPLLLLHKNVKRFFFNSMKNSEEKGLTILLVYKLENMQKHIFNLTLVLSQHIKIFMILMLYEPSPQDF